jgi:hypothetical protein
VQSSAKRALKLSEELFLFSDDKFIQLSWLRIKPPRIECSFDSKNSQIIITSQSNISSCAGSGGLAPENDFIIKGHYNEYCEMHRTLNIEIDIPEKQERQTIIIYGVVAVFIVLVLLGTFCLLQWRNSRI